MLKIELCRLGFALALPLALVSQPALAQKTLEFEVPPSVQRLTEAQDETALLNAQAERMKARAALQAAKNELQDLVAKSQGSTEDEDEAEILASAPMVVSIYGAGKRLYALLHYPSGLKVDARAGDVLDGDFVVKSITRSRVVVDHKGKEYVLRVSAPGQKRSANRVPGARDGMGGMPGMPGMVGGLPPAGFPMGN